MAQGETSLGELKASQQKAMSEVSELHEKEVKMLQSQVETLNQKLTSSKNKSQDLEKLVSELQLYKEQAQVRQTLPQCRCVG